MKERDSSKVSKIQNFENFDKKLFLQKWTLCVLIDSHQSLKSNESIPVLPGSTFL
ncbi:hypothetical protein T4E_11702 [Trichinella pseudospiralis]|uniref:Uncharacterized protein n=1 Tax=Trichinella pseudospiralis TaxID=6337 RepID=A0A0V0XDB1_TRIPS|nr:hypothetical protein T4E_11702 [Trichinella pseudospiralis]